MGSIRITSNAEAGTCFRLPRSSLLQRSSGSPLTYMELPLSAMIIPYRFRAAGNRVLVAAGCGWRDSEGVRHLIEIGSNLVPTGGLRIELEIGHDLFDLPGGAQHGRDRVALFGLLKLV